MRSARGGGEGGGGGGRLFALGELNGFYKEII